MDIETIKNEIKEHILDSVQEDAKNATISWLHTTVLPAAKEVADAYTAALQASADKETGWNKFRDQCFLPTLIDGGLWLIGKLLGKMVEVQE